MPCLASTGMFKDIMPQIPLLLNCCCRRHSTLWLPPPALSLLCPLPARCWCALLWPYGPRAFAMACATGMCCP